MQARISQVTLQKNSITQMLKYVEEFEQVRRQEHPEFTTARQFFAARDFRHQTFYKFYQRYVASGRNPELLLPQRRGPQSKYQQMPLFDSSLENKVLTYRRQGHNKYVIAHALQHELGANAPRTSASTVFRILRQYGVSRLTPTRIEEKRKIVRDHAGSLAHIDCHYLPKGVVRSEPLKRYFVLGVMDDYSRLVWTEVIQTTQAIDVTFAMLDALLVLNQRYGLTFEEALTDNGSEFCGNGRSVHTHPFERLLQHFNIRHRRTKPYRPQTNGKIERFWRTFEDEVIDGAEFATLEALKDAVVGYNFYFNEHRPHQGIEGAIPQTQQKGSPPKRK